MKESQEDWRTTAALVASVEVLICHKRLRVPRCKSERQEVARSAKAG